MNNREIKQKLIDRDGLRCSISGETVEHPEELSIEHIKPKSEGGSSELENLILVKNDLNKTIGNNTDYRTNMLIKELRNREEELLKQEKKLIDMN